MPYLIFVEPDHEPRTIKLEGIFCVGRTLPNDLVIPDLRISRRHIRFEYTTRGWEVFDNGSTSGMYINGSLCGVSHVLSDGDVIKIGPVLFTFCVNDPA